MLNRAPEPWLFASIIVYLENVMMGSTKIECLGQHLLQLKASGVTGGGGGGRVAPETSDREISADLPGKEARKKGKMGKKEEQLKKDKWKIGNVRRNSYEMRIGLFCFVLFCLFVCFYFVFVFFVFWFLFFSL